MIKLIGLDENLVETAVDEILEGIGKTAGQTPDFSSSLVIFPSRRIRIFLQEALGRRLRAGCFPPRMFTIDEFFLSLFEENVPGREYIGELEESFLLFRAAREVFPGPLYGRGRVGDDFPAFFPWALNIRRAVEETLVEGGNFENLNREIFRDFVRYGEYHSEYKNFIMEFPRLVKVFSRLLQEERKSSRGLVYSTVARLAHSGELKTPPASRFLFLGFNALNRSEEKMLTYLFKHHRASLVLRTDPGALDDPASPFFLQNRTLEVLGPRSKAEAKAGLAGGEKPAWHLLAHKVKIYPNSNGETMMAQVFEILDGILKTKKGEEEFKDIGIVLPDAASLIPFVQGVVSRFDMEKGKIPFNITLGYPFERTPLSRMLHLMLKVGASSRERRIFSIDYLDLIRHPYVKLAGGSEGEEEDTGDALKRGIHMLEDILNRDNIIYFTVEDLQSRLDAHLEGLKNIDLPLKERISREVRHIHEKFLVPPGVSFLPLCEFLREAVLTLEKRRSGYLFLEEYIAAAVSALNQVIAFARLNEAVFSNTHFEAATAFIEYYLSRSKINFQGSPLKGVQVMGMLEFRGLTFSDVIVLDAVEGVLPRSSKYDPLLPFDIRRALDIRVYSDWERLFAFNFFSLLGGSRQGHILWSEKEGFERGRRSRFIERIVYEIEKEKGTCENLVRRKIDFCPPPVELKEAKKTDRILERIREITLSPSSIETYIKCPLRFYFERVMGLREREEIFLDPDAGEFGNLVHRALKALYERYAAAGNTGDLKKALPDVLLAEFSARGFKELSGIGKIRFWVLVEKLKTFLEFDARRIEENGVRVVGFEEEVEREYTVEGLRHRVTVSGRIDRIEREDHTYRIVDYKTGGDFSVKIKPAHKDFRLGPLGALRGEAYLERLNAMSALYKNFQVLLYTRMFNEREVDDYGRMDAAYMFLKSEDKFFKEVFVSGRDNRPATAEDKHLVMERFGLNLDEIIRDIHQRESFIANPTDENYCSFCPFRIPCGNV